MRSALEIVAFTQGSKPEGVIALLEVALKALDEEGMPVIAIHVDMALALLKMEVTGTKVRRNAPDEAKSWKQFVH